MTAKAVSPAPRDRWLPLARGLCLVVLALVFGLTLFDIPFEWVQNQTVCSGASCPSGQLSPADLAQLEQSGISLAFFEGYAIAVPTITVLVFALVASVIFWRRSNDWFGIFTAIALAGAGFALTVGGPPLPAIVTYYPALLWPVQLLNMTGTAALIVFFYLFPDGHFVPRWLVWMLPLVIVHAVIKAVRPDWFGDNDWTAYPAFLGAILTLIYRYRRVSNPLQRQQTKWVVFGSIVGLAGVISLIAFFALSPNSALSGPIILASTSWYLFLLLIPLSIGMAILRSHLWDIDILIRRTLIYGVLTALLAFIYLGAVVALQAIFTALTGQQRSELVTVLSTLVIAALFVPLRNRVQSVIDRRLYRRKYDAARTLATFGAALRDEVNLDNLSARLLDAVDETMQPESVALWLVKP